MARGTWLQTRNRQICWSTNRRFHFLKYRSPRARPPMQDSRFDSQSPSPSGEQRSHAEMAGKATDMWSDGGTQTEDVRRIDQDTWMGYNHVHVHLAVNLAGRGMGGSSPAFQGGHLNPMFPDGLAHVPFSHLPQLCRRQAVERYLASVPVEGRGQPTHGPIWSPVGLPCSFHGTPRLGSMLPDCPNPEAS